MEFMRNLRLYLCMENEGIFHVYVNAVLTHILINSHVTFSF